MTAFISEIPISCTDSALRTYEPASTSISRSSSTPVPPLKGLGAPSGSLTIPIGILALPMFVSAFSTSPPVLRCCIRAPTLPPVFIELVSPISPPVSPVPPP